MLKNEYHVSIDQVVRVTRVFSSVMSSAIGSTARELSELSGLSGLSEL